MKKDEDDKKKIHAVLIFEILGKPPQYLVTALDNVISKLGTEKNIKILSKDIKEPRKKEFDSKSENLPKEDFYTSFAEVEIEASDIPSFTEIIFGYMPAHVEIISPEAISLTNNLWSEFFTKLMHKLHAYDELARILQAEKETLQRQLQSLAQVKFSQKMGINLPEDSKTKKSKKKADTQ